LYELTGLYQLLPAYSISRSLLPLFRAGNQLVTLHFSQGDAVNQTLQLVAYILLVLHSVVM